MGEKHFRNDLSQSEGKELPPVKVDSRERDKYVGLSVNS